MSYVPVIEHFTRARSCYIYRLPTCPWRWVAKLLLRARMFFDGNCEGYIASEAEAQELLTSYRNWLGENRVGA